MSEAIYKSGQGYWTRMMSAAALGLLAVLGALWIWDRWGTAAQNDRTVQYIVLAVALAFMAAVGVAMWWYLAHNHRSVEFLIATEGEMKKVNWSTKREIFGSTGVVIFTMMVISFFCFICDQLFALAFLYAGVLDSAALESK
jgi:preprotein translocase SecE subunit